MADAHSIYIAGQWLEANANGTFRAQDPSNCSPLPDEYPISAWADCDAALTAAADAFLALQPLGPEPVARFLNTYADRIEARAEEIVQMAHAETALPASPRLASIELPRTTNQLRQAAAAAIDGSWSLPTIDTKLNIRSHHAAIGPIVIFGPNNFPLAFNGISGGDFAAAIAAGNPVIVKGHPSHPGTTRMLAQAAAGALTDAGLPPATVQLIYHTAYENGTRMVADPRVGAMAFTGSRRGGLALKAAADAAGKPIYLEMSSVNPVVILPGALKARLDKIADEFADSALAASGQFCTNPGLVLLIGGESAEAFIAAVKQRFEARSPSPLLADVVGQTLKKSVDTLTRAGAAVVTGGVDEVVQAPGCRFANTLLRVTGQQFLAQPQKLQTEAFGNASLFVVAREVGEANTILDHLEGNLTGCIYSATDESDDAAYGRLAPVLLRRVGRLLNDKMPTGVAVSPAMVHGGPYPATGHPGFTAVGIPASMRRFSVLRCYDNVRQDRLPVSLRDKKPV
jgi:2,5-dioxopentanoate dehydrogenase